jgi:hypothetical protein
MTPHPQVTQMLLDLPITAHEMAGLVIEVREVLAEDVMEAFSRWLSRRHASLDPQVYYDLLAHVLRQAVDQHLAITAAAFAQFLEVEDPSGPRASLP